MVKEIKNSNAEKCGGQSWGREGLVERGKERAEQSRLGGAECLILRTVETVLERPGVWLF